MDEQSNLVQLPMERGRDSHLGSDIIDLHADIERGWKHNYGDSNGD